MNNPTTIGIIILIAILTFALIGRFIAPPYNKSDEHDEADIYD